MIRALGTVALALSPGLGAAAGLDLSDDERAAFGQEVRAAILAFPEVVDRALTPPPAGYADEAQADLARLAQEADLAEASARGIGADAPRLTIVFFESFPCTTCGAAWRDLVALAEAHPDIRIEPRFAAEDGTAQLLLSLLARRGPEAYHNARALLHEARTEEELARIVQEREWMQDRMLRPTPRDEARAFARLGLETVPSLVFPRMMVQGAVPPGVLERYVTD
ncbi:hypothetical protein OB2597_01947 [Pseudooceanicola batsensis HTCC2597]|uniref:Thioredoxin-like fold domain-containing protein n=1 Tax=Pseudooceanicola batsensis (strain ATCC BAA-863 / DSM 15984 / KCTC 12145 / HTCC2597) TaxID=252305 RepID=A3TWY3_PSEBH|nr:hypothetical protein [Pseudooceanicola batsensis]EAQ03343.1 hypothetical protein OB2597_01947 [Pseudooceanicola batsensis HTCC2597]